MYRFNRALSGAVGFFPLTSLTTRVKIAKAEEEEREENLPSPYDKKEITPEIFADVEHLLVKD